ncbi:hypothetical protein MRX96_034098 [Rhipicephalus microplus]
MPPPSFDGIEIVEAPPGLMRYVWRKAGLGPPTVEMLMSLVRINGSPYPLGLYAPGALVAPAAPDPDAPYPPADPYPPVVAYPPAAPYAPLLRQKDARKGYRVGGRPPRGAPGCHTKKARRHCDRGPLTHRGLAAAPTAPVSGWGSETGQNRSFFRVAQPVGGNAPREPRCALRGARTCS